MNMKQVIKSATVLSASAFIGACSNSDSTNNAVSCVDCAVISTVAADFGSSAVDFAETSQDYAVATNYAAQDVSDVRFLTYGDHFYRLGRFNLNNLAKYSFNDANTPIWEYSVAENDSDNPNPYDVVFVSETQAYVLSFGSDFIIEIDPNVTDSNQESDFIVNRLDFSKYSFGNGIGASVGFMKDGLLYVLLNGQDASFVPQTSRILVIDPTTNLEVDVNGAAADGALDLTVKNALDMDLVGTDIYVSGVGRYASFDLTRPVELTGGIEKVDVSGLTFTSSLLVDDNDANVNAQIAAVEVSQSDNKGYLIRYNSFQNNDLIQFNPTTGAVDAAPMTGYAGVNIPTIEVDESNQLWVGIGDADSPKIDILSIADDSDVATVDTLRNPARIEFADTTN